MSAYCPGVNTQWAGVRAVVGEIRRVVEGRTKLLVALRESLRTQQAFPVRTSGKGSSPGSDSCYSPGKGLRPPRGPGETTAAMAVGSQLTAFSACLLICLYLSSGKIWHTEKIGTYFWGNNDFSLRQCLLLSESSCYWTKVGLLPSEL